MSAERRIRYEPGLDGLRAIAVLAVLGYHGGVGWLRGGYLGVDVFFVLSGYLITTLLLVEFGRTGQIALAAFWVRRARRLLPALGLVFVGIALYAALVVAPEQLGRIRGDAFATVGYVANWRFVFSGQGYFDQFGVPSPFRHMWSLAIEEQFYLVWPFLVALLLRWRPRLVSLQRGFAGAAVASAVLMAVLFRVGSDPSRVYYGTDTRAQALLVGAALAAWLLRVRTNRTALRPAMWVRAGLIGLVVLAVMLVAVRDSASWMYRGGYLLAAIATAAVIGAAVQSRRNVVRGLLSPRGLRAVGKISYGLYLWHWPIYLTLTANRTGLTGTALLAVRLALTFAIATASYQLLELPIRRGTMLESGRRAALAVPAIGLVLVAVFLLVPEVRGASSASVAADVTTPTTSINAGPLPSPVLLVGDSVAKTMGDGFDRGATAAGLQFFNRAQLACGLAQRARVLRGDLWTDTEESCDDWPTQWEGYVAETAPVVSVVLFDVFVVSDLEIDGAPLPFASPAADRYLLDQLGRGVDILRAGGRKVVLLTAPYNERQPQVGQQVDWAEDDPSRIDHWNALLERYVRHLADPDVTLVDLNALVSPNGTYSNVLDGQTLRYDGVHFDPEGGGRIFDWLAPRLPAATVEGTVPESPTTVSQ
ncbi:MAG TPA: acyltransferase family protein [Acidimicrobiia bacterium]|nr:acyltransferase family protein [Acidimicrobiia bacterium]